MLNLQDHGDQENFKIFSAIKEVMDDIPDAKKPGPSCWWMIMKWYDEMIKWIDEKIYFVHVNKFTLKSFDSLKDKMHMDETLTNAKLWLWLTMLGLSTVMSCYNEAKQ